MTKEQFVLYSTLNEKRERVEFNLSCLDLPECRLLLSINGCFNYLAEFPALKDLIRACLEGELNIIKQQMNDI